MTNLFLLKTLALVSVPGITYFCSKKVSLLEKRPLYRSMAILGAFLIAAFIFWYFS